MANLSTTKTQSVNFPVGYTEAFTLSNISKIIPYSGGARFTYGERLITVSETPAQIGALITADEGVSITVNGVVEERIILPNGTVFNLAGVESVTNIGGLPRIIYTVDAFTNTIQTQGSSLTLPFEAFVEALSDASFIARNSIVGEEAFPIWINPAAVASIDGNDYIMISGITIVTANYPNNYYFANFSGEFVVDGAPLIGLAFEGKIPATLNATFLELSSDSTPIKTAMNNIGVYYENLNISYTSGANFTIGLQNPSSLPLSATATLNGAPVVEDFYLD
jgi:hypothetical protein